MAQQDPFAGITITSARALELLRDLADDSNRARLTEDPAAFFREYGVAFSAELLPASEQLKLPPADELLELADALEARRFDPDDLDPDQFMLHPFMFVVHPWIAIVASIANRGPQAS